VQNNLAEFFGCLISRAEAKERELHTYFTGIKCGRGHISKKYVSSRNCVECMATLKASMSAEQIERKKETDRIYCEANPESNRKSVIKYRESHREEMYARANAWKKANPDKIRSHTRNRRARKIAAEGSHTADDIMRIRTAPCISMTKTR
jgi:hypothetical protein